MESNCRKSIPISCSYSRSHFVKVRNGAEAMCDIATLYLIEDLKSDSSMLQLQHSSIQSTQYNLTT